MLFNSYQFLFLFLPVVLILFHLPALRQWRVELLLAMSLVFYGFSGLTHLVFLLVEVILVWVMMRNPAAPWPRLRFAVAVVVPLLVLAFFKYRWFIAGNIPGATDLMNERLSVWRDLILPAGISFFTFEIVCFAIDLRNGRIAGTPRLRDYFLYVAFFPHLVAGPILRWSDVSAPIAGLTSFRPRLADVRAAVVLISAGLAMKVLLADGLHRFIEGLSAHVGSLTVGATAYVVGAYSFQIYFDFYGYSLMAIGMARLFGFSFPDNFLRPYSAANPKDFWRRWHVTLSLWLRDYLYFRLGGNQHYVRNILIVFAVCGLWHGAGWNFIAWGVYHGVLVVGYAGCRPLWDRMPYLIQVVINFVLVSVGWILFLFDFDKAWRLFSTMGQGDTGLTGIGPVALLLVAVLVCYGVRVETLAKAQEQDKATNWLLSASLAVVVFVALMYVGFSHDFIYFRF